MQKNIVVDAQSNFVLNKVLIYSLSIMNGDDYSAIIAFAEPVAVDSSDVLTSGDGSLLELNEQIFSEFLGLFK